MDHELVRLSGDLPVDQDMAVCGLLLVVPPYLTDFGPFVWCAIPASHGDGLPYWVDARLALKVTSWPR
jgi:hypothetical protein